jgi:hypothetical protein
MQPIFALQSFVKAKPAEECREALLSLLEVDDAAVKEAVKKVLRFPAGNYGLGIIPSELDNIQLFTVM